MTTITPLIPVNSKNEHIFENRGSATKSIKHFLSSYTNLSDDDYNNLFFDKGFINNKKALNMILKHISECKKDYCYRAFVSQLNDIYREKQPEFFYSILKDIDLKHIKHIAGLMLIPWQMKQNQNVRENLIQGIRFFQNNFKDKLPYHPDIANQININANFFLKMNTSASYMREDALFVIESLMPFYKYYLQQDMTKQAAVILEGIAPNQVAVFENMMLAFNLKCEIKTHTETAKHKKRI